MKRGATNRRSRTFLVQKCAGDAGASELRSRSAARHNLAVAVALAVAVLGAAACGGAELRPVREGDRSPEYAAATIDGDSIAVPPGEDGRPVLLNVWATWCAPCRQEMPALEELHRRYGDRLRVVGVSVDRGGVRPVEQFVDDFDLSFAIVHDPAERVTRAFRTTAVPETFLIGADGRIVRRWIGGFDPLAESALASITGAMEGAE